MTEAAFHVKAMRRECIDRTGAQTGATRAPDAWACSGCRTRRLNPFMDEECAAVGVPKTPAWMDEQSNRRGVKAFGAPSPALKGMPRGAIERKEGRGRELCGHGVNDAPRPAVERIGLAIAHFWGVPEKPPLMWTHKAQEHDRSRRTGSEVRRLRLPLRE